MEKILELLNKVGNKTYRLIKMAKGEILFHEDDLCVYVGIVKSGYLSIQSYSYEGKEIIYNSLKPGEIFGSNLIFAQQPYYKGDVVAIEESEIILINKESLLNLLQTNREFLQIYLEIHSESEIKLHTNIKILSFSNIKERFMYYLRINNNIINYRSITDLAKTLHLSREALSRLISELKKERIIKITDKKEIILL